MHDTPAPGILVEGMADTRPLEFEDMVRPHLDYLYSLAIRLSGNRTVAEDLVQDTLLRAFRGVARLRNRERPASGSRGS
jgi:DNA-directed RNA polymerase specialized sigma24 family protein